MPDDVATYEAGGVTVRPGPAGPEPLAYPAEVVLTRRTERVDRLPKRPEVFLDRVEERAKCTLAPPFVLELYGPHGIGKTTLLAEMTHQLASTFADGVLYGDDLLFSSYDEYLYYVWDHFYSSNLPHTFVPSPATLHGALRDLEALLVIDECELSERELKSLHTIAGRCSLMLASEWQGLTDVGHSMLVTALPPEVAHDLARAQLRRQFVDENRLSADVVAQVWSDCDGNAKLFERSIARLAVGAPVGPELRLTSAVVNLCGRSPVPVEVLEAVAEGGRSQVAELAEALWRRREIDAHSPRYSVRWRLPPSPSGVGVGDNQLALRYLADEVDFAERPDLRPFAAGLLDAATAFGSGALPAAATALRNDPDGVERALAVAGRLADSYLSSGALDGWRRAALVIRRLARLQNGPPAALTQARVAHHLGTNALCRGAFTVAERTLSEAVDRYSDYYRSIGSDLESRRPLDAALALREIAQRSSGGGESGGESGGPTGSAPPDSSPSDSGPEAVEDATEAAPTH